MFIGSLNIGATENQLNKLVMQLFKRSIFVIPVVVILGGKFYEQLQKEGIKPFNLLGNRSKNFFIRNLKSFILPFRLCFLIKNHKITHVYSLLEFTNLVACLALIGKTDVKLIWGVRTSNLNERKKNYPKMYFFEKICSILSKKVNFVICNSEAATIEFAHFFKAKAFCFIPNGVDVNSFKKLSLNLHTSPILRIGLENYIVWKEETENTLDAYNQLDVFCLPSLFEGTPDVLLEAMACELPCVLTNVGDTANIIGDLSQLCKANNPTAIASLLFYMCTLSNEKRFAIGIKNRSRVISNFSIQKLTESILLKLHELK